MSTQDKIHCPNCKEDVPKTLYCLNCGYPIYKLEKEENNTESESEKSPGSEPEPDLDDDVDMSVEYEPPQETFMEEKASIEEAPEPEKEESEAIVEPIVEETSPTEEPVIEEPEEIESEPEEEPEPIVEPAVEEPEEIEPEPKEEPEPIVELAVEEPERLEPEPIVELTVEEPEKIEPKVVEPEVEPATDIEEGEKNMMDEVKIEFAPDPLTKEVMENLAKNITLKIRLTKLLRNNAVKEETFKKLFDSYVEQGRLWVSRRDDTIVRFKSDVERMEQELVSARKDFELLDIRKNIGDASEKEYEVKAPAYKWDIEHLDTEIKNCTGGIQYMMNLHALVPEDEISELKGLAESNYSELDSVEDVTSDTIARMKETLAEALNTLQS